MAITLKPLRNYYTPIKPEAGLYITYDVKEMRNDTRKLENGTNKDTSRQRGGTCGEMGRTTTQNTPRTKRMIPL